MTAKQKLGALLEYTGLNKSKLGKAVGQVPQTFYDIENGKIKSFSYDVVMKIKSVFPEINENFFLKKEANFLKDNFNKNIRNIVSEPEEVYNNNSKKTYPLKTEGIIIDENDLIKNTAIVIPIKGQAGLENAIFDPILFKDLETEPYYYNKKLSGEYFKIEVKGDSMYDGTDEGLKNGDWAYCRSLERRFWSDELYTHKWKTWCFFHNERGIIFKGIEKYNKESGEIELYSRNPDKKEYPNFTIKISECSYICNVVEKRQSLL